ncbi:sensor histidine kinase [Salinibacterium sp. ZJ450]|uniref:sensor histidine kinase n=1 Tax=Salinibacterium sp. ZJ450 TaxID=2708338 RepID=UPI00174B5908|nr:ATP-binding protein [Salinibacterium sp. ZJ450]
MSANQLPAFADKQPRNPISRRQVESIISRSVAAFGIVFGAQTLPAILDQIDQANPVWAAAALTAIGGSLLIAVIASILQRWVRPAHGLVAIVYLMALISWPFAVTNPQLVSGANHWLYYLLTVATATAAISFSTRLATAYLFVVPTLYALIRLTEPGGAVPVSQAVLDAVYAIILGGAVMIIVTMLRQASSAVDAAQATALSRYGNAVRQHATDVERVQVDAIVHDSVLTTLLSAGRAHSPEAQRLSAEMARRAIGHLSDAATGAPADGSTVRASVVAKRIADAVGPLPGHVAVSVRDLGTALVPVAAAEALYSAAVQAAVNSSQHAGTAVRRWVNVQGVENGLHIVVGDDGVGFDLHSVPNERLGVRVSIIERLANVGGRADVATAPGAGTVVSIRWPCPEAVSVARTSEATPGVTGRVAVDEEAQS